MKIWSLIQTLEFKINEQDGVSSVVCQSHVFLLTRKNKFYLLSNVIASVKVLFAF